MSNSRSPENSATLSQREQLFQAVDRWGPDLSDWLEDELAHHGREALLADRPFRAYRDGAVTLDAQLDAAAGALDARIAESGTLDRLVRQVERATTKRPVHWGRRVAAVAAMLIVSAALGGAFEVGAEPNAVPASDTQVVQLDPLVFGMNADY